jgi:hypothetical protein
MNESIALVLSACTKLCKGDARVGDFWLHAGKPSSLFVCVSYRHPRKSDAAGMVSGEDTAAKKIDSA